MLGDGIHMQEVSEYLRSHGIAGDSTRRARPEDLLVTILQKRTYTLARRPAMEVPSVCCRRSESAFLWSCPTRWKQGMGDAGQEWLAICGG